MGCDIHCYVEIQSNDDRWAEDGVYVKNPERLLGLNVGRDYELFGILAGVRDTPEAGPIAEPRGVPDDCSAGVRRLREYWGEDAHSVSYLTLKELQEAAPKYAVVKRSGFVSAEDYEALHAPVNPRKPTRWWGGGNIPDQQWAEWTDETDCLPRLVQRVLDRCEDIGCWWRYRNPERVRIVFWFDN